MSAGELVNKIFHLSRLMRRAHHMSGAGERTLGFDPFRGQGRILRLLYLRDGVPQRDIAYTLDIRPQSLGELLGKLETGGFIRREADELDKRVQLVFLTDSGREVAMALNQPQNDGDFDPFASLSSEEREQLNATLDKLIEGLVAEVGDAPEPPHRGKPGGPRPGDFPPPPEWH